MARKRRPTTRSAATDKTARAAGDAAPHVKKQRGVGTAGCAGGLAWILGEELSVDAFRQKHFEQKPLHLKRAPAQATPYYKEFSDLATPEGLFALMEKGVVPVYRINMYRCLDGSTKENASPSPNSVSDVRRLFSEGWSIQWLQPQQEHDALARLVSVLESEFGSLVGVNAYLTPPGVQGLAPHWDDVEVFVLQLGGQKAWHLHRSTTSSPLPPEAQSLPRFSSGDLPLESLSPAMLKPVLNTGDLLYMPRGTIHYAPNQDKTRPSVHLTISTYQQHSVYDLVSKTFEEAMSEMWETNESLRRGVPWQAFSPGLRAYPEMCRSVSEWLRRAADAVDHEAAEAAEGESDGCVAGALADLSAEFVKNRMPPVLGASTAESCTIVTPASFVEVIDPSVFALVPLPGDADGSARLFHCMANSRRNHMMRHPSSEEPHLGLGEGRSREDEDEGEEEDEDEEEEEDEDEEDGSDDEEGGQKVGPEIVAALRELCTNSAGSPIAAASGSGADGGVALASVLLRAKVPEASWPEVCNFFTQMSAIGLVRVYAACVGAQEKKALGKKRKRKTS
mmetsp:Transcript_81796/g.227772  ORF Transcript_81796/g.227772 Transcript_81796/m.227772 type:complete len:564 (+) Transcript_81796:61-1752(+)